jgi:hypothetical protein
VPGCCYGDHRRAPGSVVMIAKGRGPGAGGAHRDSARSASAGSTGYLAFQASKPPSRAAALKPSLFSLRATRALVASSGQVQ